MQITIDNKIYETRQLPDGKWTLPDEIKEMLSITCGALNIDGNRVATSDNLAKEWDRKQSSVMVGGTNAFGKGLQDIDLSGYKQNARYPAQAFLTNTEDILDEMSGVKAGNGHWSKTKVSGYGEFGGGKSEYFGVGEKDKEVSGCSKILHKCPYETEEYDLFNYCPKVSKKERNAGCEEMEEKVCNTTYGEFEGTPEHTTNKNTVSKNNHPTLKPISLNEKILRLFKTPNPQKILIPFAGSGSEVIGAYKAGFEDIQGCEINKEYVKIAEARIKHWTI
jgi:hypothetical protein